ncbi:GntR family transcriptional regulator [Glutamicibacter halophytocola]|uniref:GntR family transcriptional regulator n=2 Tax=Glutamicibacter halophytocola TaxID=1933880 RepID=A0AA95BT21_9MICC|nr:GntR family transcriptional regulator [Glutamicibacter halophytocola]ALG30979.1 GntR family transcriptional regulator [Glutamicibacter halophytocola]NQD42122.1 GntR family transcriptional regulator [Glutamicibacter halophytocola]UUX58783.1 GntR family transcriptional regulator [Glutamicibacter halophytocola]
MPTEFSSTITEQGSMADRAYAALRDRLMLLEIAPTHPIHEPQLAEELGIGRTPMREALKRLETDHLVVSYPRRGTFATAVDFHELNYISEMRQVLEPVAARNAAANRDPEIRAQLNGYLARIDSLDPALDQRSLLLLDIQMHRLIYKAAGNKHLEETLVRLDNLVTRIWCLVIDQMPPIAEHIKEHSALLRAILDGDADLAAKLVTEHVAHFEQALRSAP